MFKLNHEIKTNKGELVTPFLVDGTIVYCVGKSGSSVVKDLSDFDFGPEKQKEIIVAQPIFEITDELFEKETEILVPPPQPVINEVNKVEAPVVEKPTPVKVDPGLFDNDKYI